MALIKPHIPIDGDNVEIDYSPTNYVPNSAGTDAVDDERLAAHLAGINAALATSGATGVVVVNVNFSFSTSSPFFLANLVSGDIVLSCEVNITSGFNDAASQITVGTPANQSAVMSSGDIDPSFAFLYGTDNNYFPSAAETLNLYISAGTSTIGSGYVLLLIKQ